jgi:hypothetical protein
MKMMKKGKGYPDHVKDTDKTFGDAYSQDIVDIRCVRGVLNKWEASSWELPKPVKSGSSYI